MKNSRSAAVSNLEFALPCLASEPVFILPKRPQHSAGPVIFFVSWLLFCAFVAPLNLHRKYTICYTFDRFGQTKDTRRACFFGLRSWAGFHCAFQAIWTGLGERFGSLLAPQWRPNGHLWGDTFPPKWPHGPKVSTKWRQRRLKWTLHAHFDAR